MLRSIHGIHCGETVDQSGLMFIIVRGALRLMPGRLDWNPDGAAYTGRINFVVRALPSSTRHVSLRILMR